MTTRADWDISTGVGPTASIVAAGRAVETARTDRLVDDPYAEPLVRAAGSPVDPTADPTSSPPLLREMADYLAVRSRYFDDWFDRMRSDGPRQAVVLAGGLDTRAFRRHWPEDFDLFEIDQPSILEFKKTTLAALGARARCRWHPVGTDLRRDWARDLENAGFDPSRPTAWLAEGLLPYLSAEAERTLLESVHELSAPGSRLMIEAAEFPGGAALERLRGVSLRWGLDITELVSLQDKPDPADQLREHGWETHGERFPEIAERYGRPLSGDKAMAPLLDRSRALAARLVR